MKIKEKRLHEFLGDFESFADFLDKTYGEFFRTISGLNDNIPNTLGAIGKAIDDGIIRRPILVNPSGKRTRFKRKDTRWFFDDPKYGPAGQGYLPIWHYIPSRGFVDAHEGAKYYGLLDGVEAVDQDVLDKSNRDLQNIIRALQKRREKRVQKESKTMKITKEELANIIKEEVEKALEQKDDKVKMAIAYLKEFEQNKIDKLQALLDAVKNRPDSPEKTQKILDYSEQISDISNKYMQYTKEVLKGNKELISKILSHINSEPNLLDLVRKKAAELKDLKQISF